MPAFAFSFPRDYPDTAASQADAQREASELQTAYDARPKAKRPNYAVLRAATPFMANWARLWQDEEAGLIPSVVRGSQYLQAFVWTAPTAADSGWTPPQVHTPDTPTLLRCRLRMAPRGVPRRRAMVSRWW